MNDFDLPEGYDAAPRRLLYTIAGPIRWLCAAGGSTVKIFVVRHRMIEFVVWYFCTCAMRSVVSPVYVYARLFTCYSRISAVIYFFRFGVCSSHAAGTKSTALLFITAVTISKLFAWGRG
jgi:hypothetical protein